MGDVRNIVYFAYGREDIFQQTIFSILSLLHIMEIEKGFRGSDFRIVVYTDKPARFASLPLETVSLDSEMLDRWLAGEDYIHRRKTCVILDALDRFGGKVVFIDSDTWFSAHPDRLFARIGPRQAVFHICEGFVAHTGTPADIALSAQLRSERLTIRSGEPVNFSSQTLMWNTGVVGLDISNRDLMLDALDLSDKIWKTADPKGAYGQKIHHAEQFATGYAFRNIKLSEAVDCVYHYWPLAAKHEFNKALPDLIAHGLSDPKGKTLSDVYAFRYRERGFTALFDAVKMEIRRMALRLNIPVRGARRSVL